MSKKEKLCANSPIFPFVLLLQKKILEETYFHGSIAYPRAFNVRINTRPGVWARITSRL